jgi:hypothetical protein
MKYIMTKTIKVQKLSIAILGMLLISTFDANAMMRRIAPRAATTAVLAISTRNFKTKQEQIAYDLLCDQARLVSKKKEETKNNLLKSHNDLLDTKNKIRKLQADNDSFYPFNARKKKSNLLEMELLTMSAGESYDLIQEYLNSLKLLNEVESKNFKKLHSIEFDDMFPEISQAISEAEKNW